MAKYIDFAVISAKYIEIYGHSSEIARPKRFFKEFSLFLANFPSQHPQSRVQWYEFVNLVLLLKSDENGIFKLIYSYASEFTLV